jgi:metallo-beta-lactamase family protein
MRISIHGAAGGEVTGSAYLVETRAATVLVDFGLFQGSRSTEQLNRLPAEVAVDNLDAVVLTHGHLDHTGRLPLLTKAGFRGPIYATPATIDMADLILRDSARLQEADAARENRHREREGKPPEEPLYTTDDAEQVRPLTRSLPYDQPVEVARGIAVRMVEAGHMLGSASIEMVAEEDGRKRTVVFSGDLGPRGAPLLMDPVPFKQADVLFMESTYGDRDHRPLAETAIEAREIMRKAIEARGKILIPVFAVGRAQLLLYLLAGAFSRGTLPPFPIYLDSPMAIEATRIYGQHPELFDEEALAMQRSGELQHNLETVTMCTTTDESRALNSVEGPCLIMAGSGMCNGGRILHHLRHNLSNPTTHVLIVGYQSPGSLGRMLVEGNKTVRIFGEQIPVRASVHTLGGFSAHAGQTDLLHWFNTLAPARPRVLLTHGEDRARKALGQIIQERYQLNTEYPNLGDVTEV